MKILTFSIVILLTFGFSYSNENNTITPSVYDKTTLLTEKEVTQDPTDQIKKAKEIIASVSEEAVQAVDAKKRWDLRNQRIKRPE